MFGNIYFIWHTKVAPKKELEENGKIAADKKDGVVIEERKEIPVATPEA